MNSKIFFLVSSIILFFTACNEYQITTKINEDGSCERIIRVESYSAGDKLEYLPVYLNSSWISKIENSPGDSTRKTRIFSKKFASIEELNREIEKDTKLKPEAKLDKQFSWFFTYYHYTETYKKNNPFKEIPLETDFSKKEIDSLYNSTISKNLSKKVEDHFEKCIKEEIIDSIYSVMKKHSLYDVNKIQQLRAKLYSEKIESSDDLIKEMEKIYGTNWSSPIKKEAERLLKNVEEKMESYLDKSLTASFGTNVIMPGLILSTNAKSIEGNVLSWKPESDNFLFCDYKMTAESRVANIWAIIVTAIIALTLITGLLISVIRRRKE
jgi:hypothetical protein